MFIQFLPHSKHEQMGTENVSVSRKIEASRYGDSGKLMKLGMQIPQASVKRIQKMHNEK